MMKQDNSWHKMSIGLMSIGLMFMGLRPCAFILIATALVACGGASQSSTTAPQTDEFTRSVDDMLQQAFATLPAEMASQDFSGFNEFVATHS